MGFQTSKKVVSRIINGELIVIQLDTGRYHYFSKPTQEVLEYFKEGGSIECGSGATPESLKEIQDLCDKLLERKILEPRQTGAKRAEFPAGGFASAQFLRDGEQTLDQISFASP